MTIVRQPGRRGAGDQVLEPLLHLQLIQPSALLSCHHRKQRMEFSVFDVALRGVASDYKCLGKVAKINSPLLIFQLWNFFFNCFKLLPDAGKTLPESLDYNVLWLHTVAGEVDNKSGIPPPLLCFQIKDFLNGPGGVHTYVCTVPHMSTLCTQAFESFTTFKAPLIQFQGKH